MQSRSCEYKRKKKKKTPYTVKLSFCNDQKIVRWFWKILILCQPFYAFSLKYSQTKTANYSCNAKKKIGITFYIEQLLLLPGKLDETERQIIPFDIRPRNIVFIFRSGHLNFREFTKRQICIIRFSAFVKIIVADDPHRETHINTFTKTLLPASVWYLTRITLSSHYQ